MPVDVTLDESSRLVHSRGRGLMTENEFLDHAKWIGELFANGTLDATWGQIIDFTGVVSLAKVSTRALRELVARNPWPLTARRIIVAPSPVSFGLSRMYQQLLGADNDRLTVVRSEAEALLLFRLEERVQ